MEKISRLYTNLDMMLLEMSKHIFREEMKMKSRTLSHNLPMMIKGIVFR